MNVTALHRLNHNGVYHKPGETFSLPDNEYELVKDYVTVAEVSESGAEVAPKRRGRPAKTTV